MKARHTPEPPRVALAMGGILLLGMLTALLGCLTEVWLLSFSLDILSAGACFLVLNLGGIAAMVGARTIGPAAGAPLTALLSGSGIVAAASLAALAWASSLSGLFAPLFFLGISIGLLCISVSRLLSGTLLEGRASEVLNLAGVSFGVGTTGVCLLFWAASGHVSWRWVLCFLAVFPVLLALLAARNRTVRYVRSGASPLFLSWGELADPMTILLGLALLLQSSNQWAVGGWLAVYLTRKFGATTSSGLLTLVFFWLAVTCGRVLASRLPPLERRFQSAFWATAMAIAGGVFLLKTVSLSGTIAGTLLLGAAIGGLHPLTCGMAARRYPYYRAGFLNGIFSSSLAGGFFAPWLIAQLTPSLGIDVVIWWILASSLLLFAVLVALVVESKLLTHTEAVR